MKERLFVEFFEGEKQARMEKIVEELAQIEKWEDAKSASTKNYNEMIKEADARIKGWRGELEAGGTMEDVDVEWKMDDPEKGQKTLYRLDTMEPVRMEDMGLFDARKTDSDDADVSDGSDGSDVSDDELEDGAEDTPDKTDTPEAMEDREICCKCGADSAGEYYHISAGPICRNCVIAQNYKKYTELNSRIVKCREAGKPLLFRAMFGYGVCSEKADLTCFRFRDHEHGWGLDIYEPGKVDQGNSDAGKIYNWLIQNGAKED